MESWFPHILYPISRWLHIVCITLLVGGTMFYELVVPIAIEDLKKEQQLYVFARARWVFRWLVYVSVVLLTVTGCVSMYRLWGSYHAYRASMWAMIAHVTLAMIGMVIALLLTIGRRPPESPVRWMRINLMILLVAIFMANMTRHVRLTSRGADEALVQHAESIRQSLQNQSPPSTTPSGDND